MIFIEYVDEMRLIWMHIFITFNAS